MEPGAPDPDDLGERLTRLEAQVAWLMARQAAAPRPGPPRVAPPGPAPPRAARGIPPGVWIAGTGAGFFLIGTAFFFRWAVQQGWLGPGFRFAMGLGAGGVLALLSARLVLGGSRRLGTALLLAGLGVLQFSFRAGAFGLHLFDPAVGLAAVAILTLAAGALGARARSGGILTVSVASALAAPVALGQTGHHEIALALYLAVLLGTVLAVPYRAGSGGAWQGARWTAVLGTWLLLLGACAGARAADAPVLGLLLLVQLLLSGGVAWLPGLQAPPGTPQTLWASASLLALLGGGMTWKHGGWAPGLYALPVLVAGGWNLALVRPARRRLGGARADAGLQALALAHLVLAVPVALAWRWVGPAWSLFALLLAWAARRAEAADPPGPEARGLRAMALALALLASLRWLFHGLTGAFDPGSPGMPVLRAACAEGFLGAGAWALLAGRGGGRTRLPAFLALQVMANLSVAVEVAKGVQALSPARGPAIAFTLVWALSGAAQWMAGLRREGSERRALLAAGYAWMGIAAAKLLLVDLAHADTPLRALVFLGAGGIGMGAALLARKRA